MSLWICSGQSGCGKTTLGNQLKEVDGALHFDGDIFGAGGDPINETGLPTAEHLAKRSAEMAAAWKLIVKAYEGLWDGIDVPMEEWTTFLDLLIEEVKRTQAAHPERTLVVTFSIYVKAVRDYVRERLPGARVLVLNDVDGGAPRRKLQMTLDAAAKEGKTLEEFLQTYGTDWKDLTEEALFAKLCRFQGNFEAAHDDEFGLDVTRDMDAMQVAQHVRQLMAQPLPHAHEIVPGLFLGSEDAAADLNALTRCRVRRILIPAKTGREAIRFPEHFQYLQWNIPDVGGFPLLPLLEECCRFIEEARERHETVLCHCAQGRSRSAAIVIAYCMYKEQWSFATALHHVRQRRPEVSTKFEEQLKIWQEFLKTRDDSLLGKRHPFSKAPLFAN